MAEIKVNGDKAAPTQDQVAAAQRVVSALGQPIHQIVAVMVHGIAATTPGVPAHVTANVIAHSVGNVLALLLTPDDIQAAIALRQGFLAAFREGMRIVPTVKAPAPGTAPENIKS